MDVDRERLHDGVDCLAGEHAVAARDLVSQKGSSRTIANDHAASVVYGSPDDDSNGWTGDVPASHLWQQVEPHERQYLPDDLA